MKRVSRNRPGIINDDNEEKYSLPVMVGNYSRPDVVNYPSTKEKATPKHFENDDGGAEYNSQAQQNDIGKRTINRVKTTFTIKELFTSIIPKRILYSDLLYTIPLMELVLDHWPVDDHFLHMLAANKSVHKNLTLLHIGYCHRVTDKGLKELDGCRNIESFDISGIQNITDYGVTMFVKTHSRIKSFNLSHCQSITGVGVQALIMGCRNLDTITMINCNGLTDSAMQAIAHHAKIPYAAKMKRVNLKGCTSVSDAGMMQLITSLRGHVEYLNICGAKGTTDIALSALHHHGSASFKSLRYIDVSNMRLGDSGLEWISEGCGPGLLQLNLRNCNYISDTGIETLAGRCTNLTNLNLSKCHLLTDQSMIALAKYLNGHNIDDTGHDNHAENENVRLTTLSKAVLTGEVSSVKVLLDAGANINHKDGNLKFPLWHACELGYLDVALFLVQQGADISQIFKPAGQTCLHIAAFNGHMDIVMLLVGNGISINKEDNQGLTPLSAAATEGKIDIVNFLTKKGAIGDPGPGLQVLDITDCKYISDEGIQAIATCQRLNTLTMVGVERLTKRGLKALAYSASGKSMTSLNVSGRYNVSNSGLNVFYGIASITTPGARALSHMIHLTKLNLCGLHQIGNGAIKSIATHCKHLVDLNISGCGHVENHSIAVLSQTCTELKILNLSGVVKLGDDGLISISKGLRSLEYLNLFRCEAISDNGLKKLASCTNLTELNIRCCKWISDVSVCELAKGLPILKSLNVSNNLDITNRSVECLVDNMNSLQKFVCNGCPEIEPPCLQYAALKLPLLQLATMRTAGFIGLRPLAKGGYMRTREVFLKNEERYNDAALQIQFHWNLYCRRQAGKAELDMRRLHFRAFEHKNALKIQTIWRMYHYGKLGIIKRKEELKREHEKLVKAVCMVQRNYRGHLGYFKFLGKKSQRKRETIAAIKIQKMLRGHFGRLYAKQYRDELTKACVRVQRSFRNHSDRIHRILAREAKLYRKEMERKESTLIQTQWRRYYAIKSVQAKRAKMNNAAVTIQKHYRCYYKREWYKTWRKKLIDAVRLVQNCFRCHEARFHLHIKKQAKKFRDSLEKDASTIIQKYLRRFFQRNTLNYHQSRRNAAKMLQKHWRGRLEKKRIRFDYLYKRYNKREEEKLVKKAKQLYDVWREEEKSTPQGRRINMIMRTGAAMILQRTRRTILWNRRQMAIQRYNQFCKESDAATVIQAAMRMFLGVRHYREFAWRADEASYNISRWFKSLKIKWAFRLKLKEARAIAREKQIQEKKRLIQRSWDRRYDALQHRRCVRSAKIIQKHYRIHVDYEKRMAEARRKLAEEKAEEIRVQEARERVAQERIERRTLKGKLKRLKNHLSDPEKVKQTIKKYTNPHIILDKVGNAIKYVEELNDEKKRFEREQEELGAMVYSIQSRQKDMVSQSGCIDIHVTVGEKNMDNFLETQNAHMKEGRPYFERVGIDLGSKAYKMSQGQKVSRPKFIYLWMKIGKQRTAHIITNITIVPSPKLHNKHEAELRRLDLRKQGFQVIWHHRLKFELHLRRDGHSLIRKITTCADKRKKQRLVSNSWEQIEPSFDTFDDQYDDGSKLFLYHTMPPKNAKAQEAQYKAIMPDDELDTANISMDAHSRALLLEQVEYVGYSADDIDHLRGVFHLMDDDDSGTVDVDEFFNYIKQNRTPISNHIFEFHGHEFGHSVEAEVLDFGMFVKVISHFCLFDTNLMARFFWKIIDPENMFEAEAKDVLRLINMLSEQYPGIISTNAIKLAKSRLKLEYPENIVKYKDFYVLVTKMPTFLYPVFRLQHSIQEKFLGQKYWEDKKIMMERARQMVKKQRDSGNDPNMRQTRAGDDKKVFVDAKKNKKR